MKGILLATVTSILIFVGMTATFRWYRVNALAALIVFGCALLVFVFLFTLTPRDLGILPPAFIAERRWLDFMVGCFVLSASFFGGWLQLFNVTDRGYSLRMLVDMLHLTGHSTTAEEIIENYSDGRGLNWMYGIRIDGILQTGMAIKHDGILSLTQRGHRTASAFIFLRKLYKIGELTS